MSDTQPTGDDGIDESTWGSAAADMLRRVRAVREGTATVRVNEANDRFVTATLNVPEGGVPLTQLMEWAACVRGRFDYLNVWAPAEGHPVTVDVMLSRPTVLGEAARAEEMLTDGARGNAYGDEEEDG